MLTGGVIAAVVAAMTVPVPGHAVGDHTAVFRAGYRSYTSASCHPDREVNITGPVEKAYRDPVGDAVAGHGDITGAWISDLRGVVTFKIDVKNMPHDLLVIDFDTNCDDYEDYLVGVYGLRTNGGGVELYRFNGKERFPSRTDDRPDALAPHCRRYHLHVPFQFKPLWRDNGVPLLGVGGHEESLGRRRHFGLGSR
jgi:hypothetical protein